MLCTCTAYEWAAVYAARPTPLGTHQWLSRLREMLRRMFRGTPLGPPVMLHRPEPW